jgi:hypothetical protein
MNLAMTALQVLNDAGSLQLAKSPGHAIALVHCLAIRTYLNDRLEVQEVHGYM